MAGVGVLAAEPVDAGGLAEDLRGSQGPDPDDGQQGRRQILDQGSDLRVQLVDLAGGLVELGSCHERYREDEGGDPVDSGAEGRPPPCVGDELCALLPRILEAVAGETSSE